MDEGLTGVVEGNVVVMAKCVAQRWLAKKVQVEYRIRLMYGARNYKNLPNLLRAFRDGKTSIVGLPPICDLGIKEDFDAVEIWSKEYDSLVRLCKWFEKQGFETTGIW